MSEENSGVNKKGHKSGSTEQTILDGFCVLVSVFRAFRSSLGLV